MNACIVVDCVKMTVNLQTEWMDVQIELMKSIKGYEFSNYDKKNGFVEYQSKDCENGKGLLRAYVNDNLKADKVNVKSLEETIGSKKYENYEQVLLLANGFTARTKDMIQSEESLSGLTEKNNFFSNTDIQLGIQKVTQELCRRKCGKFPQKESDCVGLTDSGYTCEVRRISDDAVFHAQMGWQQLLYGDYRDLICIKRGKNIK
jgi:hypothetical protein